MVLSIFCFFSCFEVLEAGGSRGKKEEKRDRTNERNIKRQAAKKERTEIIEMTKERNKEATKEQETWNGAADCRTSALHAMSITFSERFDSRPEQGRSGSGSAKPM